MHFIWLFYITAQTDQIESKIDSTLAKVEGLMAKSGEIENRFNEVDNIHQGIKGSMQSMTLMCHQKLRVAMCSSKLRYAPANPFRLKLAMCVRAVYF